MKGRFSFIATLVKTYRSRTPWSQTDLALKVGYKNGQFVSNVERGLCGIPPRDIIKFGQALGCPLHELKDAMINDFKDSLDAEIAAIQPVEAAL